MKVSEWLVFYGVAGIMIALLVGPLFLAVWLSHRICKERTWPKALALGVGLVFVLVTLAPYAKFGADWSMAWFYLTMPFSLPLEYIASAGFTAFVLITTIIAASFWATVLYVISAVILLVQRGLSTHGR